MASLDVVSLFTNVPVNETIDIILNYVYENQDIDPPIVPRHYMKAILILCTTQSPFYSPDGKIYK